MSLEYRRFFFSTAIMRSRTTFINMPNSNHFLADRAAFSNSL